MSVTFTERKALEDYIGYIQEERTRLTKNYNDSMSRLLDEYKKTLSRLSELDKIDNVHPEKPILKTAEELAPTPADEIVALVGNSEIKDMSLTEAIEKHNEKINNDKIEEDNKLIYDSQKESLKDYDYKSSAVKASTQRDIGTIAREVAGILKTAGVPVKTGRLIKALQEKGYNMSSPYTVFTQIRNYDSKIVKAGHGYHQYKW